MKANKQVHGQLVLVGGGHSHLAVLRSFGMRPLQGVQITLIAKELQAPYSGMLPGLIAGTYSFDECHVDLLRLASFAGARLIHGEVEGIDTAFKRVSILGRPAYRYDILSLDVGIAPWLDGIKGARQNAIAVKPISEFYPAWLTLLERCMRPQGPRKIAIIGGGAAGYEIALAMSRRILAEAQAKGITKNAFSFALFAGKSLLPALNPHARQLARQELARAGLLLIEHDIVHEITIEEVILASGRSMAFDVAVMCTEGKAAAWFGGAGLPLDENGFLAVQATLQSDNDPDVFASGDCAALIGNQRPKAGVFAVRQGPYLANNIRKRFDRRALAQYRPQRHFLMLLSNGRQSAMAVRGAFTLRGALMWRWKDRIDRRFIRRFQDLPSMPEDVSKMRCGGCGAKVGPSTLDNALARLALRNPREDAAIIDRGGPDLCIETVDFFRAFWPEPYLFGEIAAQHAIGDIYAMGGTPKWGQVLCTLPHAPSRLIEENLFQLMAGAHAALTAAGVDLIGGHSSEAEEMAVGFVISGTVPRNRILRKCGLKPGQNLILTRPLGTGLLLAAAMRRKATASAFSKVLAELRKPQAEASRILQDKGATGATDVTGFGLGGHLLEMLAESGLGAELEARSIPLFDTVLSLARSGIASSLLPENLALARSVASNLKAAELGVLFDPQTAGGLLAGIPDRNVDACLDELHAAGYRAAYIGRVIEHRSGPRIAVKGNLAMCGGR